MIIQNFIKLKVLSGFTKDIRSTFDAKNDDETNKPIFTEYQPNEMCKNVFSYVLYIKDSSRFINEYAICMIRNYFIFLKSKYSTYDDINLNCEKYKFRLYVHEKAFIENKKLMFYMRYLKYVECRAILFGESNNFTDIEIVFFDYIIPEKNLAVNMTIRFLPFFEGANMHSRDADSFFSQDDIEVATKFESINVPMYFIHDTRKSHIPLGGAWGGDLNKNFSQNKKFNSLYKYLNVDFFISFVCMCSNLVNEFGLDEMILRFYYEVFYSDDSDFYITLGYDAICNEKLNPYLLCKYDLIFKERELNHLDKIILNYGSPYIFHDMLSNDKELLNKVTTDENIYYFMEDTINYIQTNWKQIYINSDIIINFDETYDPKKEAKKGKIAKTIVKYHNINQYYDLFKKNPIIFVDNLFKQNSDDRIKHIHFISTYLFFLISLRKCIISTKEESSLPKHLSFLLTKNKSYCDEFNRKNITIIKNKLLSEYIVANINTWNYLRPFFELDISKIPQLFEGDILKKNIPEFCSNFLKSKYGIDNYDLLLLFHIELKKICIRKIREKHYDSISMILPHIPEKKPILYRIPSNVEIYDKIGNILISQKGKLLQNQLKICAEISPSFDKDFYYLIHFEDSDETIFFIINSDKIEEYFEMKLSCLYKQNNFEDEITCFNYKMNDLTFKQNDTIIDIKQFQMFPSIPTTGGYKKKYMKYKKKYLKLKNSI